MAERSSTLMYRGNLPLEEPFRLFFPASLAVGILGVMLWPAFAWGIVDRYPGVAHARIMIEGFFFAFILGFLGTAGPRMLSAQPLRCWQVATGYMLWLGLIGSHLAGRHQTGDLLFLVLIGAVVCIAAARWRTRGDIVPPGFVLVALGMVCGVVGAILFLALAGGWLPAEWAWSTDRLGRHLLYQGSILFPMMGVAPFFFGRFGGLPNPHDFPESRFPPPGWARRFWRAVAAGGVVLTALVLEVWMPTAGSLLKGAAVAVYVLSEVPWRFRREATGTLGRVVQLALVLLLAGLIGPGLVAAYRVGMLHILFIGGFQLITFAVGSWVIFGHNGLRQLASRRLRSVQVATGIIILALATRLSADFFPQVAVSHYNYAAIAWSIGVVIWGGAIFWRKPRLPEPAR